MTEADKVRIVLKNELPGATSIHWHGILVYDAMDGVTPIQPGATFARGWFDKLDAFDEARITAFINAWRDHGPKRTHE